MAEQNDSPKYQDSIYQNAVANLTKVADVTGGEASIKKDDYLTKFPGEDSTDYTARKKDMEHNNTPVETINLGTSKLYRKPLDYGDNFPAKLEEWVKDVDGNGTPLIEYAKKGTFPAIRDGLVYSFVDVTSVPDIKSMTDEEKKAFDLTPKLSLVNFIDIPNRRFDDKGNHEQITISETVTIPSGSFMEETTKQYRVLTMEAGQVTQTIWTEDKDKELVAGDTVPLSGSQIPMAPFYTEFSGHHTAKPPLLKQINTCIHWFNAKSRLNTSLTDVANPTLVAKDRPQVSMPDGTTGFPDIKTGTKRVIDTSADGDVYYLELQGKSLTEQREEVDAKQDAMDAYKSSIQEKDASISTKQIGIENSDKVSQLTSWSLSASIWLTNTVKIAAEYMGETWDGEVKVNMDFDEFSLDADKMEKLSQMELRSQLSLDTLLTLLQQGEVLPETLNIDDEVTAIGSRNPTE